jgi:hypothetical protein
VFRTSLGEEERYGGGSCNGSPIGQIFQEALCWTLNIGAAVLVRAADSTVKIVEADKKPHRVLKLR